MSGPKRWCPGFHWRYRDEAARELHKLGRAVSRIGGARSDDATIEGPTTRELEVVELVAAGRTNREIASEPLALLLAPR